MAIQCQGSFEQGQTTIPEMEVGWKIGSHPKRRPSQVEEDIVCAYGNIGITRF